MIMMFRITLPSPKFLKIPRNVHTYTERKVNWYFLERLSSIRLEKNNQTRFLLLPIYSVHFFPLLVPTWA